MKSYIDVVTKNNEYFGISRYCNICGYRFSKFGNFGIFPREAQCPVCGSLERHRHLFIYISSILYNIEGKKILHFTPEPILKDIFNECSAEYYDADIDKQNATYQQDITNISFEENYFDYVFCIHVLEHINDDIKAMKELYRVLKPGGTAFLCVPLFNKLIEDPSITDPEERTHVFGQRDHVRKYDMITFQNRLKSVNFSINISDPSKFPKRFNDLKLGDRIFIAKK